MIGGELSVKPYVVAFMYCRDGACALVCSGSLVAPNVVLTAAHCVRPLFAPFGNTDLGFPLSHMRVLLGSSDADQRDWAASGRLIPVKRVVFHGYGSNILYPYDGDVALLELDRCVDEVPGFIEYVHIATPDTDPQGGMCRNVTVVGFGHASNAPGVLEDEDGRKRAIVEKLHSSTTCRDAFVALCQGAQYPDYDLASLATANTIIPETVTCLGGSTTQSTCFGDSGGPTVAPGPGSNPQVIGVTSFGFGGDFCSIGPDFVTKVATQASWIRSQMDNSFATCPNWDIQSSFASWPFVDAPRSELFNSTRCPRSDQWQCLSGACIDRSKVCDSHADCPDSSDEIYSFNGASLCSEAHTRIEESLTMFETIEAEFESLRGGRPAGGAMAAAAEPDTRNIVIFLGVLTSIGRVTRINTGGGTNTTISQRTAPLIHCSLAITSAKAQIKTATAESTIGDMWDSVPLYNACDDFNRCIQDSYDVSDYEVINNLCSELSLYLYNNNTAAPEFAATFGERFNATCPDDEYMEYPRRVYSPEASSSQMQPYSVVLIIIGMVACSSLI